MRKVLSYLLIMVFISAAFNVLASNFDEKNSEYQIRMNEYSKSREEYLVSYNQYRSECLKDEINCENLKEQVLNKTRSYFKNSIISIVSYLDLVKMRIENSKGSEEQKKEMQQKLDVVMASFNTKEQAINNVNESDKVNELSDSLKIMWSDAEKQVIICNANLYLWKVQAQNKQLNNFALDIEKYILNLSKEYDVSNLLSEYYETKVSLLELNNKHDSIKKEAESITKEKYINYLQSLTDYKDNTLQVTKRYGDILNKLKENNFILLSKKEAGKLEVKGEGTLLLNGKFEITGNLSDTKVTGEIETFSTNEVDTFKDGEALKTGDKILYKNVKKFIVKSNSDVTISSSFLDIVIKGSGKISIKGDGLYKSGAIGSWLEITKDSFEVSI